VSLPDFSVRRPVTVIMLAAAIAVLGLVSASRLKLDFLPQVDFPFIGVWAPYPNAMPEQSEREIARPIEEVMATLGDVKEVFANCDQSGAFVGVEFEFGRPVDVLRMEVREKLDQVRPNLPKDLRDTFLFTFNTNDIPILEGRISAKGRDLSGSYELLDRRVIQTLERIEGVGQVTVDGVAPQQVTIYLRMEKILQHNVPVDRLFRELNGNNVDLSVGQVRNGRQRILVRSLGHFRDLEEIKGLPVNAAGVRLDEVAEIVWGEPAPTYYRRLNGEPAIAFSIQKASGANIVEVSRRVQAALTEIRRDPALEGVEIIVFFDQAEQITGSLRGLLESGVVGSLLAVSVLFLFLRRWRSTLIVSIAIPFSIIGCCAFLYLTNRTLNVLTMMGLMLAVGMLVDNAIVVLEAIHSWQQRGKSPMEATRLGAKEVALAVTASTCTSVIVFAPVIFSKGDELTVWLAEVGVTITVTLLFSLLACLTLVPLFASRVKAEKPIQEFRLLTKMRLGYLRLLEWAAIRHPRRTGFLLLPAVLLVTVGLMAVTKFKPDPDSDRGMKVDHLRVQFELSDNSNVYRTKEQLLVAEKFLIAKQDSLGVESVYAFFADNDAMLRLYFEPDRDRSEKGMKELREYLRKNLPVQAGVAYRLGEDEEAGRGAQRVQVTVFGEDGDLLDRYCDEVRRRLVLIDGLHDLRSDADRGGEEVRIILDRSRAALYGLDPLQLSEIMGLTFRGVALREFQTAEREVQMAIVLEPSDRRNLESLASLPVSSHEGRPVQLGQVASFEMGRTPTQIHRENQKTARSIIGSYEGEEFGDVMDEIRATLASLDLPPGYSWSFGREMRNAQEQQSTLGLDILLALLLVYFVMAALFESLLHPLVIMMCVPFAVLGVIWMLILTNTPLNIMAMIGVVILIGVIVNNGIVLIDHVNNHRRAGMSRADAIRMGADERFRPILMTAGTTALGLIPLALGDDGVGQAQYFPMARALFGGLVVGTALTLLVLPTFYILAEKAVVRLRSVLDWGLGRAPLPWRQGARRPVHPPAPHSD